MSSYTEKVLASVNDTRLPYTMSGVAYRVDIAEGKLKKLVRKAISAGKLTLTAERIWRGWLGMNGAPARAPFAALPKAIDFADDSLAHTDPEDASEPAPSIIDPPSDATMGPEMETAEAEPMPVAVEGFASQVPTEVRPTDTVDLPLQRMQRPPRSQFHRLRALPDDAPYHEIVLAYIGDRSLKEPTESLRKYVTTHASKLPAHVVIQVCPRIAKRLGLAQTLRKIQERAEKLGAESLLPEAAPAEGSALLNRLNEFERRFESHQETTRSRFSTLNRALADHRTWALQQHDDTQAKTLQNHERIGTLRRDFTLLAGLVQTHGMALDALDDDLGLSHPKKRRRHLTIRLARRILRSFRSFWRTLVSPSEIAEEENGENQDHDQGHPLHARSSARVDEALLQEERSGPKSPAHDAGDGVPAGR